MGSKKPVFVDGLKIGGDAPVRVESMLKTQLSDVDACIHECSMLHEEGCELIRVAFPDVKLAPKFKELIKNSPVTIMADIHFNHRLALAALESGCRSIRINPGNISDRAGVVEIIKLAEETKSIIRIGANGGSLNSRQMEEANCDRAAALVLAVDEQVRILLDSGFDDMIISAKSSSISETLRANTLLAQKYPFPLHIGITEAGSGLSGVVKGAAGIGIMLAQGIGDTLRVSLTGSAVDEVRTGYHILGALDIRRRGYSLISCPTCGRKRIDVLKLSSIVEKMLPKDMKDGTVIAVMGCEVNGPREAASADIGIAGTPGGFALFKHGAYVCGGNMESLAAELNKALKEL